ncbi:hypothetical protein PR202_gb00815 [Eleusine coracana subsp. coracana]|uniref:Uncharacterized protein n=1 Tax=Eleusine coracana subsp. coracana TaxID=191504 RepID=A0AAV5DV00_ELECO|nr:hypothetical protein PR202_gb00815 [Eleusine coracana subsp. coracana]
MSETLHPTSSSSAPAVAEQSGQLQRETSVRAGGLERHGGCHGVVQVKQWRSSSSGMAAALQTIHMPSSLQGRLAMMAAALGG